MSSERFLSRLSLMELYALLLDTVSRLEEEGGREEAERIVRAMMQVASAARPNLAGLHVRVQQTVLTSFAERLAKVQEALAALHVLLESGSPKQIRRAVVDLGGLIGALSVFTEVPAAAPLAGLAAPVEATDVASELGGAAARVYGYIVRVGRASSSLLSRWARGSGIDADTLEEALRRLVERGLVRVEAAGGELEYVPR
ncbi:MAG: hypothetical protein QXW41_07520 [Fervidicoccaceae archaeon]